MKTLLFLLSTLSTLAACMGEPFRYVEPEPTSHEEPLTDSALPLPPAPAPWALCGNDLTGALASASAGLLWPSETDAPLHPILFPAPTTGPLDEATLRLVLDLPPDARVEEWGLDPLVQMGKKRPSMSPEERLEATRFRALRTLLEAHLSGLTIHGVGGPRVRVLIVGFTSCGELAGVETWAVET